MSHQKDDPSVVMFQSLFGRVKDWVNDNPLGLEVVAAKDESFLDLCLKLGDIAIELQTMEGSRADQFAAPVDPKFIKSWREFEARYSRVVYHIALYGGLGMEIGELRDGAGLGPKMQWEIADKQAGDAENGISLAIAFVEARLDEGGHFLSEEQAFDVREGLMALRRLTSTSLSFRAVFRRRDLVPFVFIPRQVSNHHGEAERISLLTHLRQAHHAFVYGAPFASIALMRSILEVVLRRHYRSHLSAVEDAELAPLIQNAIGLPPSAHPKRLDRLRKLGNIILHVDSNAPDLPANLEREIVAFFETLRDLIEQAPERPR